MFKLNLIVVTDTNPIHFDSLTIPPAARAIQKLLKKYHAQRLFIPPESPHFHPLESLLYFLKQKVNFNVKGAEQMKRMLEAGMAEIQREDISIYFNDMNRHLLKAFKEA